jgi:outer membrane receptor protein involved in Fe transport
VGYSLLLTNKYKENSDDELTDYRDRLDFDFSQRSRMRGTLTWAYRDWTTTVFGTRYGSNGSAASVDGRNAAGLPYPRRLPPYMLYNLSVAKNFGDNLNATLTVVNVLDNTYREDNSQTGFPFYNNFIGADPLGRRYNLSVTWKF